MDLKHFLSDRMDISEEVLVQYEVLSTDEEIVGIDIAYYTAATYTAAEEALWIDRNSDGVVTFEEWLLFNTELYAWNQQLSMATSGATALVTADVATNSVDYDNGFFQYGLPAKLDADSDAEITWTEWIVGFTASSDAWALFKMDLGDNYSISPDVWFRSYNE